jgi:hypothetical protein
MYFNKESDDWVVLERVGNVIICLQRIGPQSVDDLCKNLNEMTNNNPFLTPEDVELLGGTGIVEINDEMLWGKQWWVNEMFARVARIPGDTRARKGGTR